MASALDAASSDSSRGRFSRVEAGKEDVFSEPCDAASLLGEVIHLFEPLALQKQLALTLSLAEGPVTMSFEGRGWR